MALINYAFFIFSSLLSFFMIMKKMKADFLTKYLLFVLINSFFIYLIFDERFVLTVILICSIGLIFNLNYPFTKKTTLILIVSVILGILRVPMSSIEFDSYLKETYGIECLGNECVRVEKVINDEDMKLEANKKQTQSYAFNWYYVFSAGEIKLNEKSFRAINIMGFWFPLNTPT